LTESGLTSNQSVNSVLYLIRVFLPRPAAPCAGASTKDSHGSDPAGCLLLNKWPLSARRRGGDGD
jgi:hypothetical protein